jgi:hypothetical protein
MVVPFFGLSEVEFEGNGQFSVMSALFEKAQQKTGDSQHCKHNEKDLAYFNCAGSDATKAEKGGDQGNDKKYNGIVQHGRTPGLKSVGPLG